MDPLKPAAWHNWLDNKMSVKAADKRRTVTVCSA